jgi:hypothetical protein
MLKTDEDEVINDEKISFTTKKINETSSVFIFGSKSSIFAVSGVDKP